MKKARKPGRPAADGGGRVGEGPAASMRSRYSFSGGVLGKYASRYRAGSNVVILDPDIAEVFRNSEEVNRALREHIRESS